MIPVQIYFSEIFFPPIQDKEAATIPNRSVYAIAFRPAGQTSRFKTSYPRWPGSPSWCHGFCQRENKLLTA